MPSKINLLSENLHEHLGKTVLIHGWVHSYRKMGGIAFLIIRDGFGTIQAVVDSAQALEVCESLTRESLVTVTGLLVEQKNVTQGAEIQAQSVDCIVAAEPPPIEIDRQKTFNKIDLDVILKNRAVSLRNLNSRAVFRIQAVIGRLFREFLETQGFTEMHTPKIVKMGAEGGSEVFKLKYFEDVVYLTQSPQLYKQIMVGVFEKVYEIGHVYRAEEHNTTRHLNEYVSLDAEFGFIESEQDIISLHQDLLKYIFKGVRERCKSELEMLKVEVPQFTELPQIELEDAISIVKNEFNYICTKAGDLDPESERLICKYAEQKYGVEIVYITKYPVKKRPFYTMPLSDEKNHLTRSFDVLFRGLEITTGGQRIHNYEQLKENVVSFGYKEEDFEGYLDCFKFGMPPHGGFGMGLERLTKQLCLLENVRLASLFPRDRTRIVP
jgi:nondiscriminating aspartyl-tRNA synthetase